MTSHSIVSRLRAIYPWRRLPSWLKQRPSLQELAQNPALCPGFVGQSPVAQRYIRLLGQLDWQRFPERDLTTDWGVPSVPFAPFVAAYLVQLDQHFQHMSQLRQYLVEHPARLWALGFPLIPAGHLLWGFDPDARIFAFQYPQADRRGCNPPHFPPKAPKDKLLALDLCHLEGCF